MLSSEDTQQIAYVMIDRPIPASHRRNRPSLSTRLRASAHEFLKAAPSAWRLAGRIWSWVWPPVVGVMIGTGVAVFGAVVTFALLLRYGV